MRLLGSKPLISYVIEAAINSSCISNIVVTTDSAEVATVAKQMGVFVRDRDPGLCGDDIPLDIVIWDAMGAANEEYDYVITLQPTTPALKSETIDRALEYAEANGFDTVISVINRPSLNWIRDGSEFVPGYSNRVNSQFLPENYCETGSFLISRPAIMSKDSRIGGSIGVYEVSPDEAISISTFQDLAFAKVALNNESVAFYVNGNNSIGTGHIFRVLQLADEFYVRPTVYFDKNQTDADLFRDSTHELVGVDGEQELFDVLTDNPVDIFINDILSTSEEYMLSLRTVLPESRIVNFEDEGPGSVYADAVINALLEKSNISNAKIGANYYVVPKAFLLYQPIEIKESVHRVLVSFGGADPMGYTERVLGLVCSKNEKYSNVMFEVILGPSKEMAFSLDEINRHSNIHLHSNVDNMPEIMSACDVAISSRGRTCYELATLGIPTISIAENAREETHGFISHENGFNYLGANPSDEVIEANLDLYMGLSRSDRENIQSQLLKSDLRSGRNRVINFIHSL